jgi:hypothetical protein
MGASLEGADIVDITQSVGNASLVYFLSHVDVLFRAATRFFPRLPSGRMSQHATEKLLHFDFSSVHAYM